MFIDELREHCMAKPFVTEGFPFDEDTLVFKVDGKMFALVSLSDPSWVNLKCDPERAVDLREQYESIRPGYHMSKTHWNTVNLHAGLDDALIRGLIDHSYDEVVRGFTRKRRRELGLEP
jgi:predicted DNA-binding protein (MmcQ/YjbR family)